MGRIGGIDSIVGEHPLTGTGEIRPYAMMIIDRSLHGSTELGSLSYDFYKSSVGIIILVRSVISVVEQAHSCLRSGVGAARRPSRAAAARRTAPTPAIASWR